MKNFTLASLVLTLLITFSYNGHGQEKDVWIETFDSEHSNNYSSDPIDINERVWTRKDAGNFSYANSSMGSYAFTINDDKPGAFIASPSLNTLGTVSFKYAYKNGSSSNVFVLQKSIDGGTNFTPIDTHELGIGANESYIDYSFNVEDDAASVIIKILSDDQNAHLFIEDFEVTDFSGGGSTVEAPTFAPPAGTYTTAQDIVMTTTTSGASIYYTTDGSTPTTGSTLYSIPVNISINTLLKALASDGTTESSVTTAAYVFPITVADIATLRTKPTDGTLFILTGEAILTFQQNYRGQKYIEDATAGILIDDNSGHISTTYSIGDGITGIIGTLGEYQGMLQFKPVFDPGAATSTGNTITPTVVSATEFVNNFETYEGMLVRVNGLTFEEGETKGDFANGTIYNTVDVGGNTLEFRTSFYNVDYIGEAIPTNAQDIVGIANQKTGGYLTARFAADFSPAGIVEDPTFTPPAGTYATAQDVVIASTTPGAEIFYSLDGSNPTDASTPYTGPISVTTNTTIKAIAYKTGWVESNVVSAEYIISATPPAVPLGSTGIIIAGLLLAAVFVVRKGKLF